ncbi:EAL domain-containing protein [Ferrimonas pelagia]|uniref:EAL domain-containing protein n=1 Tax=Ferrimonas pelagia TaxID=1177826 RepID=UPI0031EC6BCE
MLVLCLALLIVMDFVQGRDLMRGYLKQAQEQLLLQRAHQMEQLLVSAGPAKASEVAESSMTQWAQEEALLAAAIIDRDQRVFLGSRLIWRGGLASRLLEGYQGELANRALLSGRPLLTVAPQRASLQLYYPLVQLKPHLEPRLLYMEQDLTPLNEISHQLFLQRLVKLWSVGVGLVLLIWWLSQRMMVRPLTALRQEARRLGEPQLADAPPRQLKEIDQLWQGFLQANQRLRLGYSQLVESEQRWLYAVEGMKAGVWDWRIDRDQVYFSHHWKAMLGYRDDELLSSFESWEQRLHPEDRERVLAQLQDYVEGRASSFENQHRLCHRDGHYIWVVDRGMIVDWDPRGRPRRIVGSHIELTEEASRGRREHHEVVSRSGLLEELESALMSDTEPGAALLAYLDLDDFKLINDVHGQDSGDRLLEQVLQRLETQFAQAGLVRRLGGDEFALLLIGLDPHQQALAAQAQAFAEQILAVVARGWLLEGKPVHLGTSIGLALSQPGALSGAEPLLAQAELALFKSKERGRGGYCLFKAELQHQVRQRLWLRDALSQGLSQGEFCLYYQPVMDEKGEIHSAEALLRWHQSQRGEITPTQFLPIAERYGLCYDLAELQLSQACRDLAVMRRYGLSELMLKVSPRQLLWPPFVERLNHHLDEQGVPARMLVLTLAGAELTPIDRELFAVLTDLNTLGVRLALDNCGAGYLALSQLSQLPVARLKLDTRDLCAGGAAAAPARPLLQAQADMAAAMALEWMATGVDDDGCYQWLRELGCVRFQGYLFSAPRPLESFLALLRTKGRTAPLALAHTETH